MPVLHGSNHDEEGGRIGRLELMPGGTPLTEAGYVQQVTETFGSDAPTVLARYQPPRSAHRARRSPRC